MAINVKMLADSIIKTAKGVAGDRWSEARYVIELELSRLAHSAADIEQLVREGRITPDRAREMFEIHRTTTRTVLESAKELAVGGADAVLSAALPVIARTVVRAIGITFI